MRKPKFYMHETQKKMKKLRVKDFYRETNTVKCDKV